MARALVCYLELDPNAPRMNTVGFESGGMSGPQVRRPKAEGLPLVLVGSMLKNSFFPLPPFSTWRAKKGCASAGLLKGYSSTNHFDTWPCWISQLRLLSLTILGAGDSWMHHVVIPGSRGSSSAAWLSTHFEMAWARPEEQQQAFRANMRM